MDVFFNNDNITPRRMISSVLVFLVLFTQSTYAATQDGFFSELGATSIENQASGLKTFTDANGHRIASFGGSLVIKRKAPNYPLWVHFQGPEIQASCSGISFKGMFGSIANLDEIQKQLEEAGSSFAWGVLVGIIYSLPGIGEIFSKLDAWAKKIQAMLADSCNAGIALGKELGGMAKNAAADEISASFPDSTAWVKEQGKGWGGKNDPITRALDCSADLMANIGAGKSCEDLKKQVKADLSVGYLAFPSFIGAVLMSNHKKNSNFPLQVGSEGAIGSPTDWTSANTNFSGGTPDSAYQDLALASAVISYTGDIRPVDELGDILLESVKTTLSATSTKPEKEAALATVEKAATQYGDTQRCILYGAKSVSIDELASFLYEGNSAKISIKEGDKTGTPSTENVSKNFFLPAVSAFKSVDAGRSSGNYIVFPTSAHTTMPNVVSNISNHITNWGGVVETASKMKNCYLHDTGCNDLSGTLFSPAEARYIGKVYRNTSDATEKQEIDNMAYMYIQAQLFEVINSKISDFATLMKHSVSATSADKKKSGDSNPKPATGQLFAGCISPILSSINEIKVAFNKIYKDDAGPFANFNNFFQGLARQDAKNNQRAVGEFKR